MDPNTHPDGNTSTKKSSFIRPLIFLMLGVALGAFSQTDQCRKFISQITSFVQPSITPSPSTLQPTNPPNSETQTTLVGVVRSSGLSADLQARLDFIGRYQITDLGPNSTYPFNSYFIKDDLPELYTNLGKCVFLQGTVNNTLESTLLLNPNETFFSVTNLTPLAYTQCSPYFDPVDPITPTLKSQIFTGTIQRTDRVAPDINYDYELILDEPFVDEFNASGLPLTQTRLTIMPRSNTIWQQIEETIGQKVRVIGTMEWGYAESRHFVIKELTSNQ